MSVLNVSPTLRDRAYHYMHQQLLSGSWKAGSMISEHSIAQELGISRTPVREAMRQLEIEGIVEQVPRFGTRVKPLDRQDLVELYQLREALEPYAVACITGQLSDAQIAVLEASCNEIESVAQELRALHKSVADGELLKRLIQADLAFHHHIIQAAGNARLLRIIAEGRVLTRIFTSHRQEHDLEIVDQTLQHHVEILNAMKGNQPELARQRMTQHVRVSMQQALQHFDRSLTQQHFDAMNDGMSAGFMQNLEATFAKKHP